MNKKLFFLLCSFCIFSNPMQGQFADPEEELKEDVQDDARSQETRTTKEVAEEGGIKTEEVTDILPAPTASEKSGEDDADPLASGEKKAEEVTTTILTAGDQAISPETKSVESSESESETTSQEEVTQESTMQTSEQESPESSETQTSPEAQESQENQTSTQTQATSASNNQSQENGTAPSEPTLKGEEVELKGIDTVDVSEPRGNWLYKRIWWERAERQYEKIKQVVNQIFESRMAFFEKRTEIDRTVLDPFYLSVGMDQGELQEAINFYIERLQKNQEEKGTLNKNERDLLEKLENEKKTIENLQKNIETVSTIDTSIDDALMKLIEQINMARKYETQAWEQFKAINRELSDKRARELFYSMDSLWKNVSNIRSYITGAFGTHFQELNDRLLKETTSIKDTLAALAEKGIDIKNIAQKLQQENRVRDRQKIKKELEAKQTQEDQEEEGEQGILGTLWSYITAPFRAVGSVFSWIGSWFYSAPSEEEDQEEEQA